MLLCDASEAVNGKLYILGAGWTQIAFPNVPFSVSLAVLVEVPWTAANERHDLLLHLLTDDGQTVTIQDNEVEAGGEFEVGRPTGMKAGSAINTPLSFRFDGIALAAGGYVFELSIDGTVLSRSPFRVGSP